MIEFIIRSTMDMSFKDISQLQRCGFEVIMHKDIILARRESITADEVRGGW